MNTKMFALRSTLALLLMALCFSCDDSTPIKPVAQVKYILNEKEVTQNEFATGMEDENSISVQGWGDANSKYGFTDEQLFLTWIKGQDGGEELFLKFSLGIELREYALNNGVVTEFEETGKIREDYVLFAKKLEDRINGRTKAGLFTYYKDFDFQGSTISLSGSHPTLFGFNDKISSWKGLGVATLCSKTFFRGHKYGIRNAGELPQGGENLYDFNNNARSVI
jgi:hypothetical protein